MKARRISMETVSFYWRYTYDQFTPFNYWTLLKCFKTSRLGSKRKEKLLRGKETLLAQLNGARLEKNPRIVIARSNISQMLKEAQNNAHAYLSLPAESKLLSLAVWTDLTLLSGGGTENYTFFTPQSFMKSKEVSLGNWYRSSSIITTDYKFLILC